MRVAAPFGSALLLAETLSVDCVCTYDIVPGVMVSGPMKTLMVATQPQTSGSIFEAKPTAAAWRAKPAWYVVASNDRMIDPAQERAMAKQMKAKTTELPSSHVAMLSHPKEVARVIEDAAGRR